MSERLEEFRPAEVVVIAFAPVDATAALRDHLEVDLTFLADPDRGLYRRFDLGRGSLREVWRPATLKLYRDLIRRGRRLRWPRQDTRQLGGDFVVDGERRLVAAFTPRSPDARPTVDELLAAVRRAAGRC